MEAGTGYPRGLKRQCLSLQGMSEESSPEVDRWWRKKRATRVSTGISSAKGKQGEIWTLLLTNQSWGLVKGNIEKAEIFSAFCLSPFWKGLVSEISGSWNTEESQEQGRLTLLWDKVREHQNKLDIDKYTGPDGGTSMNAEGSGWHHRKTTFNYI